VTSSVGTAHKVEKNNLKERIRVPFIGFLVVFVLAVSGSMDMPPFLKAWEATTKWNKAPGITKRSGLAHVEVGKDPAWRPLVVYKYKVEGVEYTNDVIAFQPYIGLAGYEANVLRMHYTPGTCIDVTYDPKNPADSVLEPLPHWDYLLIHFVMYVLFAALVYLSCYPPAKLDES